MHACVMRAVNGLTLSYVITEEVFPSNKRWEVMTGHSMAYDMPFQALLGFRKSGRNFAFVIKDRAEGSVPVNLDTVVWPWPNKEENQHGQSSRET